jgi:hypothetical protein
MEAIEKIEKKIIFAIISITYIRPIIMDIDIDTDDKSKIISPTKFNFLKYTFTDVRKQIYCVYISPTVPITVGEIKKLINREFTYDKSKYAYTIVTHDGEQFDDDNAIFNPVDNKFYLEPIPYCRTYSVRSLKGKCHTIEFPEDEPHTVEILKRRCQEKFPDIDTSNCRIIYMGVALKDEYRLEGTEIEGPIIIVSINK